MEECVKDNLRDAMGGLADCRARIGKASMALNDALGAVSRLEKENQRLKEELEALRADQPKSRDAMDADGVPIYVGDYIYHKDSTVRYTAYVIDCDNGEVLVEDDCGTSASFPFEEVSHTLPDSWEKLAGDVAGYDATDYAQNVLDRDISMTTYDEDAEAMKADVIRRAKRLAGVGDGA